MRDGPGAILSAPTFRQWGHSNEGMVKGETFGYPSPLTAMNISDLE
jgi:hypothetical protein